MTETSSKEKFLSSSRDQWSALVEEAKFFGDGIIETARRLSEGSNVSVASVKGKIKAIRWAMMNGWTADKVIESGQLATLRAYAKAQRNGGDPERMLRWRVSRRLADAIMSSETSPDQEESLVTRLVRVAKLRTSNDFWEFLLSVFSDLSDKDIAHLAGLEPEKRKR